MAIMTGAKWTPTNAFTSASDPKIGAVVHVSAGSAESAIATFQNTANKVSAHFVVSGAGDPYSDGTIFQMVDTADDAWAQEAGNYAPTAYIAIEFSGLPTAPMTTGQVLSGAAIVAWASKVHGFPLVGVVPHGMPGVTSHSNPDGTPDPAWGDHVCPGSIRLAQIPEIIYLAALANEPVTPAPAPAPVVSKALLIASTPTGKGYWLVQMATGAVEAFGDAEYHGGVNAPAGTLPTGATITGFSPTADGGGYWITSSDGGVYAYGDAEFYGVWK